MLSRVAIRTYGTVSPEQRNGMTGLEFVQGLADGNPCRSVQPGHSITTSPRRRRGVLL